MYFGLGRTSSSDPVSCTSKFSRYINLAGEFSKSPTNTSGRVVSSSRGIQCNLSRWGKPDVDLLASRFRTKLDRFVSNMRDLWAFGMNALANALAIP